MTTRTTLALPIAVLAASASTAHAQLSIPWFTIDGGGGTSTGDGFTLSGTIGQPDAGPAMVGGAFALTGGYWSGVLTPACPGDFNGVNGIDVFDLLDFLTVWFAADPAADLNGINGVDVFDLLDFLTAWFDGC